MDKANLNPTDGFILHGWMVTELHLDGGDLITFGLVHQFTQGNAGIYKGNTSYLSAWTGWSENTCRSHLNRLIDLGLVKAIRGRINNTPYCHYVLADDFYQKHTSLIDETTPQKLRCHPSKIEVSTPQKLRGENNNKKIIEDNTTHPSVDAVADYVRGKGFKDPSGFASYYVEINDNRDWIAGNGKPVKNWKNNILNNWMKYKDQVFTSSPATVTPTPAIQPAKKYYSVTR